MESVSSPRFRSALQYFEREDHGSVPLLSLYQGLLHIFEGYKPSLADILEQPSALNTHFQRVSQRLGFVLSPPGPFVNQMGYDLLLEDKAIELFTLNVSNNPVSYNVYDSLGEAYQVKGETDLAIQNYERSLELNPANENARDRLEVMRRGGSRD